jgi:hypothetical protein
MGSLRDVFISRSALRVNITLNFITWTTFIDPQRGIRLEQERICYPKDDPFVGRNMLPM